jgi:hypothetical protein
MWGEKNPLHEDVRRPLPEVRARKEKHDGLSIPEINYNIPSEGPISQASFRVVWATMILEEDKI